MGKPGVSFEFAVSVPLADNAAHMWMSLAEEMAGILRRPRTTTLVVTDRFTEMVSELQREVPAEHGGLGAAASAYDPMKPDGALATARTLPVDDRTVVVINAGVGTMGKPAARHVVHHETQHVRLHQAGDSAWAMQRRAPFERPVGFGFDYVIPGTNMIDEYRCEAALGPGVAAVVPELSETPDTCMDIADLAAAIREQYFHTGDLAVAYDALLGMLNRLGPCVGYSAATIARGEATLGDWSAAAPVGLATATLLAIPAADVVHGYRSLAADVVRAAQVLGEISEHLGFEISLDEGTGAQSLYFVCPVFGAATRCRRPTSPQTAHLRPAVRGEATCRGPPVCEPRCETRRSSGSAFEVPSICLVAGLGSRAGRR